MNPEHRVRRAQMAGRGSRAAQACRVPPGFRVQMDLRVCQVRMDFPDSRGGPGFRVRMAVMALPVRRGFPVSRDFPVSPVRGVIRDCPVFLVPRVIRDCPVSLVLRVIRAPSAPTPRSMTRPLRATPALAVHCR